MIRKIRNAIVAIAVAAMMIAPLIGKSSATASPAPTPAFADVDINAESKTLDAFAIDLAKFDKKGADLGDKPSLTRDEFVTYERQGEDLKRRVSGLQTALRRVVEKLKAAGQWDNLDQTVLSKISDSDFQNFVRTEGFKKTLEGLASGRGINVNEIASPVESLRKKVAQDSTLERGNSPLASRVVRVSYAPTPAMVAASVRCSLAMIRFGFSGAIKGESSGLANMGVNCYCKGQPAACRVLDQLR